MTSEDDSDDASAAPARRIIDVQLDDDDDGWEDMPSLGTSTHRTRNPGQSRISHKQHRHAAVGKNGRASALKRRDANISKMQRLGGDLDAIDAELAEHTERLATKYSMKPQNVRRQLLASSSYKNQCKPSLYNAKISGLMAELNADHEGGTRLTIPEVKAMVKDDPSLLEGYTSEQEAEMLANLTAKRERRHHGTRANNISATADIKRTMSRLVQELNGMAQRANMVGFTMFSRGHLHDTSTPTTISTGGALDFFRDVLKKEPADVSALFELWAVNREHGEKGVNTLQAMQKECTDIILTGLMAVTKRTKVAMNYENYIKSMVEGKNIGLIGWPQGVAFKRMSLQSALPPLKILRDALNAGSCRWKVLPPSERQRILDNFEDMVEKGEAPVKATKRSSAKKRQDEESSDVESSGGEQALRGSGATGNGARADVEGKRGNGKGDGNARPTKHTRAAGANSKKTRARNEDAPVKPKKSSAGKGEAPAKQKEGKTSAGNGEPPAKKRKTRNAGEDNGQPPAKRKKTGDGEPSKKKRKKSAADSDGEPPAKKRKKTSTGDVVPAAAMPRPQPRRLYKKPAEPTRLVSLKPHSLAASAPPASPKHPGPVRSISPKARSAASAPHAAPAHLFSPTSRSPAASGPPASPNRAEPARLRSPATADPPASPKRAAPARAIVKGKRGGPPGQR
ncbi:hypothetical protein GGX14DRAFT_576511 [Mycena pura]|uniref:Uncharacterized protein n=1 Tax=Mycena pura TaxID=153505 RepID=A0AAD6Y148_9AGAR|nr:hypothetical protein GGX14DRAFT_576511 [Mycena pura]